MNKHYKAVAGGLKDLARIYSFGGEGAEAAANTMVAVQASLAAAKATDDLLKAQETANLIAYAQLQRQRRQPSLAAEDLVKERMASRHPEIKDELDEEDGN